MSFRSKVQTVADYELWCPAWPPYKKYSWFFKKVHVFQHSSRFFKDIKDWWTWDSIKWKKSLSYNFIERKKSLSYNFIEWKKCLSCEFHTIFLFYGIVWTRTISIFSIAWNFMISIFASRGVALYVFKQKKTHVFCQCCECLCQHSVGGCLSSERKSHNHEAMSHQHHLVYL